MLNLQRALFLVLALGASAPFLPLAAAPATPSYPTGHAVGQTSDWMKILPPCPKAGDAADTYDLAVMAQVMKTRTDEDIQRAISGSDRDPKLFDLILGSKQLNKNYPETVKLMEEAYNDIHATLDPLKASLHRPRPYVEHPDIVTVPSGVPTDGPNSFPSAHAV
jgi:hypothetical protein